ncbi:carbohydrate ABC transporter permease [Limnochorda pilosa]|uniref:Sugar ABC transporter permease n=1 Tax=Limnochorda pilosa TaxID=1555112 RepID=A0A0K2SIX0_LIMPI|nr:carbohydrate ABC transporter permease [Limnochorda pilosa]BAS26774.1 sugar ABC transporter permease [Limnochorda pilosa]
MGRSLARARLDVSDPGVAYQRQQAAWRVALYVMLVAGGVLMIAPFLWMLLGSFKTLQEVSQFPPTFLPKDPILSNYTDVFERLPMFARYYLNTIVTAVIPTVVAVFTAAMAGYGFAKYRFRGGKIFFWAILATMMIPYPVTIVPLYVMAFRLGLVNSYAGLIVVNLSTAFGIFMMRQFALTIPDDLLDAARIDGCSEFRIFGQVILPLLKPALATLTIFTFTGNWNAYVWPLLIVNEDRLRTLSLAIPLFNGQYEQYPNLVFAASTLAILPVIILFVFNQRYFTEGITLSGLKD